MDAAANAKGHRHCSSGTPGATATFAHLAATGNSISAHTKAPIPSTRHSAPKRSGMPLPVPEVLARTSGPAASASSPSGTLTKKIHRQDNSTSSPPTGGPRRLPSPLRPTRCDRGGPPGGRDGGQQQRERARHQHRGADA